MVFAQANGVHRSDADGVRRAKQEARVREPDRATAHARGLQVRQRGLIGAEVVDAVGIREQRRLVAVQSHFAADLVSVIVANPRQAHIRGRLLIQQRVAIGAGTHILHAALSVAESGHVGEHPVHGGTLQTE